MSDQPLPNDATPDVSTWLPFDNDADQGEDGGTRGIGEFSYIGRALTIEEFTAYLDGYDFGSVPPDYVVLHHTGIPTLAQWTAGEEGMSDADIRAKRVRSLNNLMVYYRDKLGWSAGPHLFIDERYICLFTPMSDIGIHAMWGNSHHVGGPLHYSIGIEVVGNYQNQQWPSAVAMQVSATVNALQRRLKTFELRYLYADPALKPGLTYVNGNPRCPHPDRLRWGGISSHRDYNKPECPGAAITEDYYMSILQDANGRVAARLQSPTPGSYIVVGDHTHVRQGPGTSFPSGGELAAGTVVNFDSLKQGESISGNSWWGHLTTELGFVAMALVKPHG